MPRFDMMRAEEAMEAARVERARLVVSAFATVLEHVARFFREMAHRGLTEHGLPGTPSPLAQRNLSEVAMR